MVNSILDKSINYPELRKLDPQDKNYDATAYEVEILGKDRTIALGQAKYSFEKKNILYFPLYLVVDDTVDSQIGVYEIFKNTLLDVLDEEGDVDLEKLHNPLLYSFAEDILIKVGETTILPTEVPPAEVPPAEVSPAEVPPAEVPPTDSSPTDSSPADNDWSEGVSSTWIQKFMKDNNYKIVDNEGGGDCLFAAIRDGLEKVGRKVTVQELREQLAAEATQEIFENYKLQYDSFNSNLDEVNLLLTQLVARNKELKTLLTQTKDRSYQSAIINEAKELKENYKNIKQDKAFTVNNLDEFKFMKGINNLDEFKKLIKTCKFWGETWAISTLERVLNIKLILFSHEAWLVGDIDNVLHCGHLNDSILEQIGVFEPSYYVILDYNGWHYKLITYKNIGALTFKELPKDIKILIKEKCLEKNAGPYYLIPQFKTYKKDEVDLEEIDLALNDDKTVFVMYNLSADKSPGKGIGIGEKIDPSREKEFIELSNIKNWRRKLAVVSEHGLDDIRQNPEVSDILLKTKDAKLLQFKRGETPVQLKGLMEHRQTLQKLSNTKG